MMSCTEMANDELLAVCRKGNVIKVDYMDSIKGITAIKTALHSDTLQLTIRVDKTSNAKPYEVEVPAKAQFIKYGLMIREIANLSECSNAKVLSGKEALEYLK